MSYFVYEVWTRKVVLASGNIMRPTDPCIHLDTKDYSTTSKTLAVRVFVYDAVGTVTYDFVLNNGIFGYFFSALSLEIIASSILSKLPKYIRLLIHIQATHLLLSFLR